MASKTARFFVQLCQLAEIDLGFNGREKPSNGSKRGQNGHRKQDAGQMVAVGASGQIPFVLTITPEMAAMDTDQLAEFFKKIKTAIAKANAD